ncbi:DUF4169 family protein [Aliiruegeria haliotis]|nr:DUF4169 family protein [Aliiruegeria haliotis]
MSKPINLNRVRKQRARDDARRQADRNAVLHGLPGAEKARAKAEAEREARAHEAGRRAGDEEPAD